MVVLQDEPVRDLFPWKLAHFLYCASCRAWIRDYQACSWPGVCALHWLSWELGEGTGCPARLQGNSSPEFSPLSRLLHHLSWRGQLNWGILRNLGPRTGGETKDGRMWILDVTVTTPGKVLQECQWGPQGTGTGSFLGLAARAGCALTCCRAGEARGRAPSCTWSFLGLQLLFSPPGLPSQSEG